MTELEAMFSPSAVPVAPSGTTLVMALLVMTLRRAPAAIMGGISMTRNSRLSANIWTCREKDGERVQVPHGERGMVGGGRDACATEQETGDIHK